MENETIQKEKIIGIIGNKFSQRVESFSIENKFI